MTEIDFYIHVKDKWSTTCRLVAKAYSRGLKVALLCPNASTCKELDDLLWSFSPTAFIPHCHANHPEAAESPVTLLDENSAPLHDDVLVNLHPQWPPQFSRFKRLVEIVSEDEEDKKLARARFKFYRDRGYEIRTHDLSK